MTKFVKKLLNKGIGAVGDKVNEQGCLFILYQPKACRRGESRKDGISKGTAAYR